MLIHHLFNAVVFPFADMLGKGLRAAGDVRFTVVISPIIGHVSGLIYSGRYLHSAAKKSEKWKAVQPI